MVTDLRAVNKVIQPMALLQSGIPLPSLLPKGWPLIVIDLKDCFFTIPLQEKDREKFAFTQQATRKKTVNSCQDRVRRFRKISCL